MSPSGSQQIRGAHTADAPTIAPHETMAPARMRGVILSFGQRRVLIETDLDVAKGESVAITGPSGAGKSSLLWCLLGLLAPDSGLIEVAGRVVTTGRRGTGAQLRREKIGAIFQDGSLLPELSPVENVALAGLLAGLNATEANDRADTLLRALDVPSGTRGITEFSGGEQQRVAVARALINNPALLVADEPTGSLDPQMREQVCDLLFALPARFDCGLVVVTHDPIVARRADRWLVLDQGHLTPRRENGT